MSEDTQHMLIAVVGMIIFSLAVIGGIIGYSIYQDIQISACIAKGQAPKDCRCAFGSCTN